ncbi:MAG TPA: hypothetical protein VJG31_02095 [Candidatus Nanoarchaeia archaeon]|nr:hypothetical protein [Candidatus Nanoarchaeia archaeon]
MNTKQRMGVVGGLAALLGSGCVDEKKDFAQETGCVVNGLRVKTVYHQVPWEKDYTSLELYNEEGKLVMDTGRSDHGTVKPFFPWVRCDDGKLIKYSEYPAIFYVEEAEKK